MKKLLFTVAIATLALVSCNKIDNQFDPQPVQDGAEIVINFDRAVGEFNTRSGGQPRTRAFFDNTPYAEPWEKEIKTAEIYVCSPDGKVIMRKEFSASDAAANSTRVLLPLQYVGQECRFYALVNYKITWQTVTNESQITTANNSLDCFNLNGGFDQVSTRAIEPFIMSGVATTVINPQGETTNVAIPVKRPFAKLAMKIDVDPGFTAKYGGKIVYVLAHIKGYSRACSLFPSTMVYAKGSQYVQYADLIGNDFCNLFYINETYPPTGSEVPTTINIKATFDQDGNTLTPNDRFIVEWEIPFNGSGEGRIKRNAYYRLRATIKSMNVIDKLSAIVEVDEWENPETLDDESLESHNQKN